MTDQPFTMAPFSFCGGDSERQVPGTHREAFDPERLTDTAQHVQRELQQTVGDLNTLSLEELDRASVETLIEVMVHIKRNLVEANLSMTTRRKAPT